MTTKRPGILHILKWLGLIVCGGMFCVYWLWPWTPPGILAFHIAAVPFTAYLWLREAEPRTRRILKWGGAAAATAILLACVFSLVWCFVCGSGDWSVSLLLGRVQLELTDPPAEHFYFRIKRIAHSPSQVLEGLIIGLQSSLVFEGVTASGRQLKIYSLPLWAILAVVIPPSGYLWWLDRRRPKPGYCQSCGYNLTGNVSGVCSECGTTITSMT